MRILYFSDVHLAERPPLSRSDMYVEHLFWKLEELRKVAEGCAYTLFGGDLFHWIRPNETSHRLVARTINLFREWPTHIWFVAGNHDEGSDGLSSLGRMPLGVVMDALDGRPGRLLSTDLLLETAVGAIQLVPWHWTPERDKDPNPGRFLAERRAEQVIGLSHAMVMPPGGGWPFPAIGMDEIASDQLDLVICGHTHWRTPIQTIGKTTFGGPGSVARTQRVSGELGRTPAYALIELTPEGLVMEFKELECALPAEEVFATLEKAMSNSDLFRGYVAALEAGISLEGVSIEDALAGVGTTMDPEALAILKEMLGL